MDRHGRYDPPVVPQHPHGCRPALKSFLCAGGRRKWRGGGEGLVQMRGEGDRWRRSFAEVLQYGGRRERGRRFLGESAVWVSVLRRGGRSWTLVETWTGVLAELEHCRHWWRRVGGGRPRLSNWKKKKRKLDRRLVLFPDMFRCTLKGWFTQKAKMYHYIYEL